MEFNGTKINWPLANNRIRRSSESHTFGMVRKNSDGSPRPHQGWDFYAPPNTECYSISDGVVKFAGERGALGLMVVISIGDTGYYAAYAHLNRIAVKVGESVKLGDVVGNTGNTGNAVEMTGKDCHLHFEIRENVLTGTGLEGRISPLVLFKVCPLNATIDRPLI